MWPKLIHNHGISELPIRSKYTNLSLPSSCDSTALKSYCWAFLNMAKSPDILEGDFCGKIKMNIVLDAFL